MKRGEYNMNELRAIVYAVWASVSAAASSVGIDRHRMARILSGETDIYGWEAAVIADAAGMDVLDVIQAAQSVRRQRAGPQKKSPRKCCSTSGSGQ